MDMCVWIGISIESLYISEEERKGRVAMIERKETHTKRR